jgi:hypothetical protein
MSLQETSGSLDFQIKKDEEIFYYINFSKLSNVNDLVKILASLGFGISDKNPYFEDVKEFLDLDKPVTLK